MIEPLKHRLRGEPLRTLLALYYIAAGGFGLKATLVFAPQFIENVPNEFRLRIALGFGGIAAVFAIIVVVGAALQRGWRFAGIAAITIQILQIPQWSLDKSMYQFLAGFYAGIGWTGFDVTPFAGWKASLEFATVTQAADLFVGVNIIPIVTIFLLEKVRRGSEYQVHPFSRK